MALGKNEPKIITNKQFNIKKFPQSTTAGRNRLLTHLMKDKSQIFAQPIHSMCETEDHSNTSGQQDIKPSTVQHIMSRHKLAEK